MKPRFKIGVLATVCALASVLVATPMRTQAQEPPKRFALLVGLNRYPSADVPQLKYTASDVQAVAEVLRQQGYAVATLVNQDATRRTILFELQRLRNVVREQDALIVFFAGHSVRDASENTYLLTYDSNLSFLAAESLRAEELIDALRDVRARNKLVLIDTFFGGDVLEARSAQNDARLPDAPPVRVGAEASQSKTILRNTAPIQSYREALLRPFDGTVVVSAHHETAELDLLQRGAFAAALLRGLSGAADRNSDGRVSEEELVEFLGREVERLTAAENTHANVMTLTSATSRHSIVAESLPPGRDPRTAARAYEMKLAAWSRGRLISDATHEKARAILARWVAAADGTAGRLSDADERILEELQWHLEFRGPEEPMAAHLNRMFEKGLPPPGDAQAGDPAARDRGAVALMDPATKKETILYRASYALVIGVSRYAPGWHPLPGVKEDVKAVKPVLEAQGFTVTVLEDPTGQEFDTAMDDFIATYGQRLDHRLLIYFAGHGHTEKFGYGDPMGYLVTKDAPPPETDRGQFRKIAIDMHKIEGYALGMEAKHVLFVFDSCFAGSIFSLPRAAPHNIEYKTTYPVRQFITSGSADETVPDRSIFRELFVQALAGDADVNPRDGYVTGSELGEFLQSSVINHSRDAQHPQYGKIRNPKLDRGDFVFDLKGRK